MYAHMWLYLICTHTCGSYLSISLSLYIYPPPQELPFLFFIAAPSVCCFKTSLLGWPVWFGLVFAFLDPQSPGSTFSSFGDWPVFFWAAGRGAARASTPPPPSRFQVSSWPQIPFRLVFVLCGSSIEVVCRTNHLLNLGSLGPSPTCFAAHAA
jgi:hypothetical protein